VPLQAAPFLDIILLNDLQLWLHGEHQIVSAGHAVVVYFTWLQKTGPFETYLDQR
ncbi:hypothetical protein MKW94_004194, partial [Papaver nudicaule]|nr:hypothetical protein [Papaver nudicaule]